MQEEVNVYNQDFDGPTYSVKYLGIVDGTMGILSRKMAMQQPMAQTIAINSTTISNYHSKPTSHVSMKAELFAPVLGAKSYVQRLNDQHQSQDLSQDQLVVPSLQNNSSISPMNQDNSLKNGTTTTHMQSLLQKTSQNELSSSPYMISEKPLGITNIQFNQESKEASREEAIRESQIDLNIDSGNRQQEKKDSRSQSKYSQNRIIESKVIKSKGTGLQLTGKSIVETGSSLQQQRKRTASKESQGRIKNSIYQLEPTNQIDLIKQNINNQQIEVYNPNNMSLQVHQQQFNISSSNYYTVVENSLQNERVSGYPKPELYDQHYINKYAFPKGLSSYKKVSKQKQKLSLYDMDTPLIRKGIAGWKLTKRPIQPQNLDFQMHQMNQLSQMQPEIRMKPKMNKRNQSINNSKQRVEELPDQNSSDEDRMHNIRMSRQKYRNNSNFQNSQDNITNINIGYNKSKEFSIQ